MSKKLLSRKPAFFGAALDPTDDELKFGFKAILARDLALGRIRFRNPYDAVVDSLRDLIDAGVCTAVGEIDIPSWLTPTPTPADLPLVTAENNVRFIDEGGCLEVAERVGSFVQTEMAGSIPAMVAVDHSTTGGVLRALAEEHGPSNLTVLVVDSHFDGLQLAERMELASYGSGEQQGCADNGAESGAIPESYNCATWLRYMLQEGVILPDKLIVFGTSDHPSTPMRQDPGLSRYLSAYRAFEEAGVTFVTREEIRRKGVRDVLNPLLNRTATDRLYISLDADIGSLDAVHAARFMNVKGLSARELYELARVLGETLEKVQLVGLDVCGIETFLLGREFPNGVKDMTLERLSDFIRVLICPYDFT